MKDARVVALAIAVADAPPTEFRIFAAGKNTTTKGMFLFDDKAAKQVMAAYQAHGADVMIDLEHLSLEQESNAFDPDARGWCKLELRNGELWATDVKWTPDGEARLSEKRQRYISPAFEVDPKTKRIANLLNIAITALPATDKLTPLVAANNSVRLQAGYGDASMSPEQFAALAEALGLGADANVEDVLATVAAMVKKIQDAANGDGDPEDKAEAPEGAPPAMQNAAALQAASRVLARLSGKKGIGAAMSEVEVWRESHLKLEAEQKKLAQDRATLEGGERRRLVAELVKSGAETPAFAWAAGADGTPDGKTPAPEYAAMSLDRLRSKVATRGGSARRDPTPPAGNGGEHGLTERELEKCKARKIDPKKYAANKAAMTGEKVV